jgi:hypothetical protein
MKKIFFLTSLISLPFSFSVYAFDLPSYLNSRLSNNFNDLKTNMSSGCRIRNFFDGNKCTVFWTQFNEYLIQRGEVSNIPFNDKAGHAVIPISCQIVRHKLDWVTNPDSTDKNFKVGDELYSASYNVKFSWFIQSNPFSSKENFFIYNNEISSEYTSGSRDNNEIANEYCTKSIANAIRSLNGSSIN